VFGERLRSGHECLEIRDSRARSALCGRAPAYPISREDRKGDRNVSSQKMQAFMAVRRIAMSPSEIFNTWLYAQLGESKLQCLAIISEHLKIDARAAAGPAFQHATDQARRKIRKETHRIQGDMAKPPKPFKMHWTAKDPSFRTGGLDDVRRWR
jgi:hypothetical protein